MCNVCKSVLSGTMSHARHVAAGSDLDRHYVRSWLILNAMLKLPAALLPTDDHVSYLARMAGLEGTAPKLQTLAGQLEGPWNTDLTSLPY